jgi:small subunit ribosomal protein S1
VLDFGVFVRLPLGIEGLVHVSEIEGSGPPESILQPGDRVLVRVISIEPEQQRLGLSRRRVTTAEEIEWMARHQDGQDGDEGVTEPALSEVEGVTGLP